MDIVISKQHNQKNPQLSVYKTFNSSPGQLPLTRPFLVPLQGIVVHLCQVKEERLKDHSIGSHPIIHTEGRDVPQVVACCGQV